MRLLLLGALTTFGLHTVSAEPGSRGEQLLWQCASENDGERLLCMTYLSGFLDGAEMQSTVTNAPRSFCLPKDGISHDQARRIMVKWLEAHPKDLHRSARSHIILAFIDAFPCNK